MAKTDLEYQWLACEMLGLIHPDDQAKYEGVLLELGHFRIIDSEAVTTAVVERYLYKLRTIAAEVAEEWSEHLTAKSLDDERRQRFTDLQQEIADKAVLVPEDFYRWNGRGDSEERREGDMRGRAGVKSVARKELARLQRVTNFIGTFEGYCEYLDRACPRLFFRLSQDIQALVPDSNHTEHAYILSTTGTGKSELLKAFTLNYVRETQYASVLILDPGGDMSRQIAQWPELIPQGRLVYIDPALSETHVPVINPFDVTGLSRREKGKLAGQIVAVIGSLVEGKMGGDISTAMESVLYPSVRLLIDLPNTSLADLPKIMIDDPRLLALGMQSSDERVAGFFRDHFGNVGEMTKASITQKVNSILDKGELRALLCGRNSIDLRHMLDNQMVVVANLAKGALDFEESRVIGMLLVAMAQSIGMDRVRLPEGRRPKTYLIVDECQNFITGELKGIIRETRKFGLSVILAQQELGGDMPHELRKVVTKTTNVKVAGRSDLTETRQTANLVGVSPEAIARCGKGEFYYRAGNRPAFKLRVRIDRLGIKSCVSLRIWEQLKQQQLSRYYRPIKEVTGGQIEATDKRTAARPAGRTPFEFE